MDESPVGSSPCHSNLSCRRMLMLQPTLGGDSLGCDALKQDFEEDTHHGPQWEARRSRSVPTPATPASECSLTPEYSVLGSEAGWEPDETSGGPATPLKALVLRAELHCLRQEAAARTQQYVRAVGRYAALERRLHQLLGVVEEQRRQLDMQAAVIQQQEAEKEQLCFRMAQQQTALAEAQHQVQVLKDRSLWDVFTDKFSSDDQVSAAESDAASGLSLVAAPARAYHCGSCGTVVCGQCRAPKDAPTSPATAPRLCG